MAQKVTLSELRSCLEKASSDKEYAFNLNTRLSSDKPKNNLKNGYYGVIEAMLAEHTYNPFKKMSFFNQGKERLEGAIKKDLNSVELRYLRLGVQSNTPSFLGYNQEISSDKAFIIKNISKQKDILGDLYTEIVNYLLLLKSSSPSEKEKLQALL